MSSVIMMASIRFYMLLHAEGPTCDGLRSGRAAVSGDSVDSADSADTRMVMRCADGGKARTMSATWDGRLRGCGRNMALWKACCDLPKDWRK